MNFELVLWFAGVIATLIGIKFIWTIFRTLFSKQSMVRVIDKVGEKASNTSERMAEKVAESIEKRREKKREANKPVVYIR